jgi:hypothetical protein
LQSTSRGGSAPRIAVNGAGQAFAIWVEPAAAEDEEIWSARFVP